MDYLPLTTRDTVPVELEHEGETIVYRLAVPSLLARQRLRRDIAAAGVRYPGDAEIYQAMREDIRALIAEADVERLVALIDSAEAEHDKVAAAIAADIDSKAGFALLVRVLGEDGARTFRLLERDLRRSGGAYAGLVADRACYIDVGIVIAAQRFLVAAEGLDPPIERHGSREQGAVTDASLDALPPGHLGLVGLRALALLQPDRSARKNSQSSPNMPATPASSPAADSRPKAQGAGGSARKATPKTRSSDSIRSGTSSSGSGGTAPRRRKSA